MTQYRKPPSYIFILGEPILKRTVYLGIAAALIVGAGILFFVYSLLSKNHQPGATDSEIAPIELTGVEVPVSNPVVDEAASPLVQLLNNHIEATQIGALETLFVNGTARSGSLAAEVILMARRPNLYKLKTRLDRIDYVTELGYDGQAGWFKQNPPHLQVEGGEFFMLLALFESSLTHLAWSYQSDDALEYGLDTVLELLPSEQWEERTCAVVMSRSLLPLLMYHYIDLETYEEVYRRAQILKEGKLVAVEIHYAPSSADISPRIPMGYELYVDGALQDTVRYTKVGGNRTLLSRLFETPVDASASGLALRR